MYNILKRMYLSKPQKIDKSGLDKAVLKGWISLEQENEILSLAQKGGDPLSLVGQYPDLKSLYTQKKGKV